MSDSAGSFQLQVLIVESRHTGQKYVFKVLYKSLQAMAAVGKGRSKDTTNRTPVGFLTCVAVYHTKLHAVPYTCTCTYTVMWHVACLLQPKPEEESHPMLAEILQLL